LSNANYKNNDAIKFFGNVQKGEKFIKELEEKKNFLFSFVISYTETSQIPGITFAGSTPELIQFTPPADAEYLYYGHCKTIKGIPMTPDGKPTPALLTKVALESASIPHIVINAGSKIEPDMPFIQTGLSPGKDIVQGPGLTNTEVLHAIDFGRIVGRTLASVTDCLIIGECIPGGTTTSQAVLRGLGINNARSSSSIPENPAALKEQIMTDVLNRLNTTKEPFSIISEAGDPMIPFVAGMLSSASKISKVILAGGTQMAAVLALAKTVDFNSENTAIATTTYITNDKTANFVDMVQQISSDTNDKGHNYYDVPIIAIDPKLDNSKIEGLQAFSKGFAKEGVGAGGCMIASMLKSDTTPQKILELAEAEYIRMFTLQ
jgi:uncharacterized protein (TIGR00303 family)